MEKASYKVMEIDRFDDEIFYRVACQCGSADCDMHMTLQLDRKTGYISILFEKKMITSTDWDIKPVWFDLFDDPWKETLENLKHWLWNLLIKTKNKLKHTWTIWVHGYLESSADLLMNNEKHIESFLEAIEAGKEELNKIFEDHKMEQITKSEEATKNKQRESDSIEGIQKGKDSTV
jgi:hypothetical protein